MGIRLPYQLNFVASLESSATINLEKHELLQSVRTSRGAGVCDLVIVKSKLSKSIYEFRDEDAHRSWAPNKGQPRLFTRNLTAMLKITSVRDWKGRPGLPFKREQEHLRKGLSAHEH